MNIKKTYGYILIITLLLLWEIGARYSSYAYLPAFSTALKTLIEGLQTLSFLNQIFISLFHAFCGLFIATLIMVPLGILMGRNDFIFNLLFPLVEFFRPMPSAAIIPIAILFLGIGYEMKLFVITFGSTWSILLNTITGVRSIEPVYLKTAKVFQFNLKKRLFNVIIPAALPSIFTGMRISLAISLILTITVEMIVGGNGIGYYILDSERSFHFPEMYAGLLALGILGVIINKLFQLTEKKVIHWHYGQN